MIKREKVYDIFIAMGGADTKNLNIQILKLIPAYFKVVVATTTANKNIESLKTYIKDKSHIDLYINSSKMARLINQSKFAIVTPSVIVHEILFLELSFLAIKTADNQDDMYKYLKKNNFNVMNQFNKREFKEIVKWKDWI